MWASGMSATWRIANGRFERLFACSSTPPSRSGAQLLIGTLPGLRTQGRAAPSTGVLEGDASGDVSVAMTAGPSGRLLVRPFSAALEERGENETGSSSGGAGRRTLKGRCALPLSVSPIDLQPMTASGRGQPERAVRR